MDTRLDEVRRDADHDNGGSPAPLKVLIADDHPLVLLGIRRALENDGGLEIVGEARSGPELIRMVERRAPDVVLMDLNMPRSAGAGTVAEIRERSPQTRVVVVSVCDDQEVIDSALAAGASSFVVKSVNPSVIAAVLHQAATGAVHHAPSSARRSAREPEPKRPVLTDREATILAAVAAGLTTREISKQLWVSEHTVKFHLTNIYRKVGVSNRSGAVRYALENGLDAVA